MVQPNGVVETGDMVVFQTPEFETALQGLTRGHSLTGPGRETYALTMFCPRWSPPVLLLLVIPNDINPGKRPCKKLLHGGVIYRTDAILCHLMWLSSCDSHTSYNQQVLVLQQYYKAVLMAFLCWDQECF